MALFEWIQSKTYFEILKCTLTIGGEIGGETLPKSKIFAQNSDLRGKLAMLIIMVAMR